MKDVPGQGLPASPVLHTERLALRPFRPADAESLHALWTAPAVRRFLWDDLVVPLTHTREMIRQSEAYFAAQGFGLWALQHRATHRLAGFGGYWFFHDPPVCELVLGLDPACWGRGYATEAGRILIDYAFTRLGFDVVHASTDAGNVVSQRLLERLGLQFDRRAMADGLDTMFYRLPRPSSEEEP
jgi:RimJ/RimL family protein N-acetyltransferase